ncbi:MAG TPA: CopD family protein [Candidatus Acidoferrum sp.]|jgi:putative copper resistance protein D
MYQLLGIFSFLVVLLRAAILGCQTVAVGGISFLLIVARGREVRSEALLNSCWKLIRRSALALALTQLFFVVTNSLVLTASADIPLREVFGANFVLAGALAMFAGIVLYLWPKKLRNSVNSVALVPAILIIASSVLTSHAASRMEDRAILVAFTSLHYLATATWIGGLPYLLLALRRTETAGAKAEIARNFSRLALISVVLLFSAGLSMSLIYVGSWSALYGTSYGIMVATKIALFGCLLLLGAANFYIVRGLQGGNPQGAKSLLRFGEVEIGIGLTVILAAASLTSQPPGADLPDDRVSLHEIAARYAPRMPRFASPSVNELSPSSEETYKQAAAQGRKLPAAFVPGELAAGTTTPGDIAWSEYNHNWAGLIVFLMGILAVLSRSRYFSWAKIWPLMFLGLAVFLFLRADPENWPLGPNGFWESFAVSDVLQHRAAVLLIIAFALFQYGVETHRVKSHAAALVFPGVCAIGGIVLLTHSHALSNVKESMLIELSHTPLAIVAVVAGWSRWLELRLPEENPQRKYLAWVWPVCFVLIGLILMDYHES